MPLRSNPKLSEILPSQISISPSTSWAGVRVITADNSSTSNSKRSISLRGRMPRKFRLRLGSVGLAAGTRRIRDCVCLRTGTTRIGGPSAPAGLYRGTRRHRHHTPTSCRRRLAPKSHRCYRSAPWMAAGRPRIRSRCLRDSAAWPNRFLADRTLNSRCRAMLFGSRVEGFLDRMA